MSEKRQSLSGEFPEIHRLLDGRTTGKNIYLADELDRAFERGNIEKVLGTWKSLTEVERARFVEGIVVAGKADKLPALFMGIQGMQTMDRGRLRQSWEEQADRADEAEGLLKEARDQNDAWFRMVQASGQWTELINFMSGIVDAQSRTSEAGVSAAEWRVQAKINAKELAKARDQIAKLESTVDSQKKGIAGLRAKLEQSEESALGTSSKWREDYIELEGVLKQAEEERDEALDAASHDGEVTRRIISIMQRFIQIDLKNADREVRSDLVPISMSLSALLLTASGFPGKTLVAVRDHKLGSVHLYAVSRPDGFKGDDLALRSAAINAACEAYEEAWGTKPNREFCEVVLPVHI